MIQKSEQGVQRNEHLAHLKLPWDDYRLINAIARNKSLRATAREFDVSVNTIRNHIERLEIRCGQRLLDRGPGGVILSEMAQQMAGAAAAMDYAAFGVDDLTGYVTGTRPEEIRIGCSEGIGEFWLARRLPQLQAHLPHHIISLANEIDQAKVHSPIHDVSLGFTRPTGNERIVARIGSVHFMLYMSEAYAQQFGVPQSFDDARDHRFVVHEAPGLRQNMVALFLGEDTASRLPFIRVNTSHSLFRAVADGVGIGALPTYVRAITRQVRPVDLAFQLKFDMWLSYAPHGRRSPALRQTIDWLRECFDPVQHPWFGDEFVHPNLFDAALHTANVVQLHDAD
jgi:DNA-binding transcriptional LysR family regulator